MSVRPFVVYDCDLVFGFQFQSSLSKIGGIVYHCHKTPSEVAFELCYTLK